MPASEWLHLVHLLACARPAASSGANCVIATSMPSALRALFVGRRAPARVAPSLSNCRRRVPLTMPAAIRLTLPSSPPFAHPGPCRAARLLCYGDAHVDGPVARSTCNGAHHSSPGHADRDRLLLRRALAPRRRSTAACRIAGTAAGRAGRLPARWSLQPNEVRLNFVGHSTWLIESAAGVEDRHRLQRLHPARGACPTSSP